MLKIELNYFALYFHNNSNSWNAYSCNKSSNFEIEFDKKTNIYPAGDSGRVLYLTRLAVWHFLCKPLINGGKGHSICG